MCWSLTSRQTLTTPYYINTYNTAESNHQRQSSECVEIKERTRTTHQHVLNRSGIAAHAIQMNYFRTVCVRFNSAEDLDLTLGAEIWHRLAHI